METKNVVPEGSEWKLLGLQIRYVLVSMLVYIGSFAVLYLLTGFVDLAVSIHPLVLLALYVVYVIVSFGVMFRVMHSKWMKEFVSGWLKS